MSEENGANERPTTPLFVWGSTESSIRRHIPSALAALEVLVALIGWWSYAAYFQTFGHIWISICVAPLLLLRSNQSITLGAAWFFSYKETLRKSEDEAELFNQKRLDYQKNRPLFDRKLPPFLFEPFSTLRFKEAAIVFLAALAVSSLVSYLLIGRWIVGHEFHGFWVFLLIGFLSSYLGSAASVAAMPAGSSPHTGIISVFGTLLGPAVGAGIGDGFTTALLSGAGVAFSVVLQSLASFLLPKTARSINFSFELGIWLRTLAIRFLATAHFLKAGFWKIPTNFSDTLFVIDARQLPELMPGYRDDSIGEDILTCDGVLRILRRAIKKKDAYDISTNLIRFLIFFIPAYVYRLSIKSTCWLYLPLVYVAGTHDFGSTPAHFIDRLERSRREGWRRALATLTLAGFIITTAAHNFTIIPEIIGKKFVSPIEYFFLINMHTIRPWQALSLLSAAITFYLFFSIRDIQVDKDHVSHPQAFNRLNKRIHRLKFLMSIRNVFSGMLILILVVHFSIFFKAVRAWIPNYILQGLAEFYGSYMPNS
jgi:hypothetical protein